MKRRFLALLLVMATMLSLCTGFASAANSEEEALGEVDIYNGGTELSYLSMNGRVRTLVYTYYKFISSSGQTKEIPAYCVNPNTAGVPQSVAPGESIEYLAEEKTSDPKVLGIVANGYPTRGLTELGLENKEQGYYCTKMALWCYLLSNWDINNLRVNPNLTGVELQRAQKMLSVTKDIYVRGTSWSEVLSPEVTCTPDRSSAYTVTIDGKAYQQQVFTFWSKTWVTNYAVQVSFSKPEDVPVGTRIVDLNNKDITTITTSGTGDGYAGKFKVLYPANSVAGETGSVQLSFRTTVYKYAVYYAVCAETGKYGTLQNYVVDTDPTVPMALSAYSNYAETPTDTPDTGLKILKLETGSDLPLSGALFEVVGPDGATVGTFSSNGDGEIILPLTLSGNYTVIEKAPPANHLLGEITTQNVNAEYGKVATVTFYNAPYGTLTVEKRSNTGMNLPGAVITIRHIESGKTYTATTNYSGRAIFTGIQPGAYRVQEVAAPSGWKLNDTVYTATVVSGETTTVPIVNEELPGLRIIKYDRKTYEAMSGVTFEIFRDTVSLGKFQTDEFGEILLTNATPGTYLAYEVDTGDDGHILNTTPQQVELAAGDGIKELLFFNDVKPGLHLVKVDSTDPSKVIPNAVFEIKSVAGDYGPTEFTTDEHGEIDLSKLPTGAYVVTEKSCPGYVIDQVQRIIQLDANENAQFVFTNSVKPSLQLIKTSADGSRLAGVTFRIARIADGSHYLDRTTNAQGEILIADLEPGVYSVKETATVTDHLFDPQEYHVELFPGQTSTIVLQNDKRPNLTIHKNDADTGEPVAGAVFTVKAADGSTVTEVKTGADGTATVKNLLPIVYEVTEKSVPSPYLLDAPSQLITLHPNRDSYLYFENHKKPSLTVNKIDSITGDPIKGAKFQVWYTSNNTTTGELNDLGCFYSDENGQFTMDAIQDGWYKITELEPAAGYAIKDPATQELYIKGGESKTVTFENTPLSAIVIKKVDADSGAVLQGAKFRVLYLGGTSGTGGTVIGEYTTSVNGTIVITSLKAGTYVIEETKAPDGYEIDETPQTVYLSGKDQDVVMVEFSDGKHGNLIVQKLDSITKQPLPGAQFKITYADGSFGANDGGAVSSNGIYTTDDNGQIRIVGIKPGSTLVVTETKAPDGYALDATSQTVKIDQNDTQTLTFTNTPIGGLIIVKSDYDSGARIKGAQFEVKKANGEIVGTYTTGSTGTVTVPGLSAGWYIVTETRAADGYLLDATERRIEVKDGGTATLTVTNEKECSILIHKTDADTGKGIYGVTFVIYDSGRNPIDQVTTNQSGYAYIDAELTAGKYYIRELEPAEGYLADTQYKTVYVKPGTTTTVEWENTAVTGQIQITKYAAEYNSVTGAAAGTKLRGAVFEIVRYKSGVVVGYITTDARGVAASPPLPLGRYIVREVTAPAYYQLSGEAFDVDVEFAGQIVRLTAYNKPAKLGVSITKTGNKEVLAGSSMTYSFIVANTSNVALESFFWHDRIPTDASTATALVTGTYSQRLNYRVLYKTNYNDYRVLASNLLTTTNYSFALSALPLMAGEVVTDIYFDFGTVPAGFQSMTKPMLTVAVSGRTANGYYLINRADVGGKYQGTWETGNASWITIIRKLASTPTLPKTGF